MQRKLLTEGSSFKRTDGRWCSVVWYMDEEGERKRKSFCGLTKQDADRKAAEYVAEFKREISDMNEAAKPLADNFQKWMEVFKFPSIARKTYDSYETIAKAHIYPALGNIPVQEVKPAQIKALLTTKMNEGYSFGIVKTIHNLLNEFFRYLVIEEILSKSPLDCVPMIKKRNFFAAQGKELLPENETIVILTKEEIARLKQEAFRAYPNGMRVHEQAAAYIFMLNTGLRTCEMLGVLNSDIDLTDKVVHITRGVIEVRKRNGAIPERGTEVIVGKPKTASSRRDVPLNSTAVAMVKQLREERYLGEETPLVSDERGGFTEPMIFRDRYRRLVTAAGINKTGLHVLRHTFATSLVNGVKQPDGTVATLLPRQVADLLGHTTSQITERYYVKKDNSRLDGITDMFNL